jgi:hypothetical protein
VSINSADPNDEITFAPGTIAHSASWARIFIERYLEKKNIAADKYKSVPLLLKTLTDIAKRTYEISIMPSKTEEEKIAQERAFHSYIAFNQTAITQAIGAAYYFSRIVRVVEPELLAGEKDPDVPEPKDKEFSALNFEKLDHCLLASLSYFGYGLGRLAKSSSRKYYPDIKLTSSSDRKPIASLFNKFSVTLSDIQEIYTPAGLRSEYREELTRVYYGGFHAGNGTRISNEDLEALVNNPPHDPNPRLK